MIVRRSLSLFCASLYLLGNSAQAQTVKYIHTDALGSVVMVTDANRNVVERREYEPYGAQLTPVIEDGPGYTGHVQDAATGLTYMQQRYYDPLLGVFLSIDPVGPLSNTQQFNRYRYSNGNPYSFVDPDGRFAFLIPMLAGGVIGAGVDILVQKSMSPDKPINKTEVAAAFGGGAVTAGVGGVLVTAVSRGAISVGSAIAIQAGTNTSVGVASAVATNASEGKSTSAGEIAATAAVSAVTSVAGSGVAVRLGDFAGAAKISELNKMASSKLAGVYNVSSTTMSTGNAIPAQSVLQAGASQGAQASIGSAGTVVQPLVNDRVNERKQKER